MTFFPQEDVNELNRLRGSLTPFLQAVMKALSVELELGRVDKEMRDSIIDEIMQNIPAGNATSTTVTPTAQTFETLHLEFDGLLNLR